MEAFKQFHPYLANNHLKVYSNMVLKRLQKIRDQTGHLGTISLLSIKQEFEYNNKDQPQSIETVIAALSIPKMPINLLQ